MTIMQVRYALAMLLQAPPLQPAAIAALITKQLRRNEESRRAHWRALGLRAPRKRPPR